MYKRQSLVDTNKVSDSQPFDRPGLPSLSGVLGENLNNAGIWWRRPKVALTGKDPASLGRRAFIAWIVCAVIVVLTSGAIHTVQRGVVFLIATLPIVGAVLTWAFLQLLPRSSTIRWTIVSRVMTTVLVMSVGGFYGAILMEFFRLRFDDDWFAGLMFMGLLVEWRCFISADRYPRVGGLKTLYATAVFFVLASMASHMEHETAVAAAMVCGVVITIQLFAPQYQIRGDAKPGKNVSQTPAQKKNLPWADWLTRAVTDVESKSKEEING